MHLNCHPRWREDATPLISAEGCPKWPWVFARKLWPKMLLRILYEQLAFAVESRSKNVMDSKICIVVCEHSNVARMQELKMTPCRPRWDWSPKEPACLFAIHGRTHHHEGFQVESIQILPVEFLNPQTSRLVRWTIGLEHLKETRSRGILFLTLQGYLKPMRARAACIGQHSDTSLRREAAATRILSETPCSRWVNVDSTCKRVVRNRTPLTNNPIWSYLEVS